MSRSGYNDDYDCGDWALIRWRGAVASAIRGRRGQAFLKEMLAALDAIPTQRLIAGDFANLNGVCALGAVGAARGIDMSPVDPEDREQVRDALNIPVSLAAEIMFENDEAGWKNETPELRWDRVRRWVASQITPPADSEG